MFNSRRTHRKSKLFLLIPLLLLTAAASPTFGQTTAFTYQGRLTDGGTSANGSYDILFRLFDAPTGGTQQGIYLNGGVAVTNGVFTAQLNLGNTFPGDDRYLEIAVRQSTSNINAPFTTLSPRQQITSTPYAIRSASAASADIATNALQIGGVPASQFVVTGDPRLSDPRPPAAGSSNYVQNTTVAQASSNFNISGNGTAGGTLTGNSVNAATEYDIGGSRVLSVAGPSNTFVGLAVAPANSGFANSFFGNSAGAANTTGANNSFFGNNAGMSNTGNDPTHESLGGANSFFGSNAGMNNTTGFENTFLGNGAGNKTITGGGNTFVGGGAGVNNIDGSNNTYIGSDAVGTPSLFNATAIGAGASVTTNNTMVLGTGSVTVKVPGNLAVTGTLTAGTLTAGTLNAGTLNANGQNLTNLNASNITSGTLNNARLGVVPIANGGTGSTNQDFVDLHNDQTIAGNKTFSSPVDTTTQYNILGQRILSISGARNVFVGKNTGTLNTGSSNSFFGSGAGTDNLAGGGNSFFGDSAGTLNSAGEGNSFFGEQAGLNNSTGNTNSFFGEAAGFGNLTGSNNSFFGLSAGAHNTSGEGNVFIGDSAGLGNSTGSTNTAIGENAGFNLGPGSSRNVYIANGGGAESDTIRIGQSQTRTFVAGINFVAVTGTQVLVNANGQLGILASSRRFKRNIRDMGATSSDLLRLRPVTFQYKPEYSTEPGALQYGLIAEEVAKVNPNLVAYAKDGQPYTVLYHLLTPMLLNEVQKEARLIHVQEQQLTTQTQQINVQSQQLKAQAQQLAALTIRLARVEAQQAHRRHRQRQVQRAQP